MERPSEINPQNVLLMSMTSLMTLQRDVKVSLLYSCLNEIVTFSAIQVPGGGGGGGGGALRVKISRGAPLEVQNGTQQDLNKMIDLVNLGGKKIVYAENVGLRNGTQQDLNKIVDMVKFGRAKRSSRCRKWGAKPRRSL